MQRSVVAVLLLLAAAPLGASGIRFDPSFTPDDFVELSEAVGDVVVFPNLGPVAAGGLAGFEVMAAGGGPRVKSSAHWWRHGVDGSTTAGVLAGGRAIARKGLPVRLDVGGQVGKVLGRSFWGAEARWALLKGGVVEPALAVRASYSRLDSAGDLRLEVSEVQLVVSKGFTLLSPYAAGGYRRVTSRGFFGDPAPRWWDLKRERWTGVAGVRFNLLPFRIVAELRRGSNDSVFVGAGVGL